MLPRWLRNSGYKISEKHTDTKTEQDSQWQRMNLLGKPADTHSGDNALESGSDNNADDLSPDFWCKPCSQAVQRAEHAAQNHTEKWFVHRASLHAHSSLQQ